MKESRHRNGIRKAKERARRSSRMLETIKQGKLPYSPVVMSWLSTQLDKRSKLITQADVNHLLASAPHG